MSNCCQHCGAEGAGRTVRFIVDRPLGDRSPREAMVCDSACESGLVNDYEDSGDAYVEIISVIPAVPRAQIIDLFEALKQSLAGGSR